jgi:hypothetical protein
MKENQRRVTRVVKARKKIREIPKVQERKKV